MNIISYRKHWLGLGKSNILISSPLPILHIVSIFFISLRLELTPGLLS